MNDAPFAFASLFAVPVSVAAIAPLVGRILIEIEARDIRSEAAELHLFYNGTFHRLRQSRIDEELFDLIAAFEELVGPR